jgi:predicted amidohydrolase
VSPSPILAAVQSCPRLARSPADVKDNIRRSAPLVERAAALGASLIVMPELCATGYSFLGPEEAAMVAEPPDGQTFQAFRQLAVRAGAYLAYGFVEDSGTDLHNSAIILSPSGEMVSHVRKCFLAGSDYLWAQAAPDAPEIVETDLGRMAAVVCRDLKDDPPGSAEGAEGGLFGGQPVDIVCGLTNWGKGFFPSAKWIEFAQGNECVLVVSNRWGYEVNESERHGKYASDFGDGGSCIVGPEGRVYIQGLRFGEDCVVAARPEVGR